MGSRLRAKPTCRPSHLRCLCAHARRRKEHR